jgi:hypothetical protein
MVGEKRLMLVGAAITVFVVGLFVVFNGKGQANQQGSRAANQASQSCWSLQ